MRLRHVLAVGLTTAATITPAYAAESLPPADRPPTCGKVSDHAFPVKARIHDGPKTYRAGGGPGVWYLDLTNTTHEICRDIHPVIVLSDHDRSLPTTQLRLELADDTGRWLPLSLERSDEDETIGVLDDGSPGYVLPAGGKVTVRARLGFAAGTHPNNVVLSAATVQRRGDDGDWVGESNPYRFAVLAAQAESAADTDDAAGGEDGGEWRSEWENEWGSEWGNEWDGDAEGDDTTAADTGAEAGTDTDAGTDTSTDTGTTGLADSRTQAAAQSTKANPGTSPAPAPAPRTSAHPLPEPGASRSAAAKDKPSGSPSPSASATKSAAPELANTGSADLLGWSAAIAALLAAGVALTAVFRGLRP
jgi:hypothetical protein